MPVVAAVPVDGVVVGLAGDQHVAALGAAQHHGVAEEVVVAQEVDLSVEGVVLAIAKQRIDVFVGQHLDQQVAGHRVAQPGR